MCGHHPCFHHRHHHHYHYYHRYHHHLRRFNRSLNQTNSSSATAHESEDMSWLTFGTDLAGQKEKMIDRYDTIARDVLEKHFITQVGACALTDVCDTTYTHTNIR